MLRVPRLAALLGLATFLLVPAASAQDAKPAGALDLPAVFKKLDANNDGKLTADEFAKLADLPEVKEKLSPRPGLPGNLDLEKLKERIGPEKLEKLKEKFGGKLDPEKLKELIEKRKNKDK